MSIDRTFFSGNYIDRRGESRADSAAIAAAFSHPDTRFLPIWDDRCGVGENGLAQLHIDELSSHVAGPDDLIFLGQRRHRCFFAVSIESEDPPRLKGALRFVGLRELSATLPEADAALAAYAKAMINWRSRHVYCGACGTRNIVKEGGFIMACVNPACGHKSFPRLDPAIIVLVHRGERCLLGRQTRWPEGRFSTIAGFVEPGESLEDSVRREVREETNIEVGRCEYMASQPWPFPSALMIGYYAEGTSDDIRLNDGELAEAKWLSRTEIADGAVTLPPRFSIAYRLIESWFDRDEGRPLAAHHISDPPLRSAD